MGTDAVRYVPTLIRWEENGQMRERFLDVQEGISIKTEQSGNKIYKPTFDTSADGKFAEVKRYTLKKEEAYNILGISHANENSRIVSGQTVYVLDVNDIEIAKKASPGEFTKWIGYGGRFVKANTIFSNDAAQNGGLNIVHKGTNSNGKSEEYSISLFYNNPKK